jgi:hypothetical protein
VLGVTTREQVLAQLGPPGQEENEVRNGVSFDYVAWMYETANERPVAGDVPIRLLVLRFHEDKLVGRVYSSSFTEDSTDFSVEAGKQVVPGSSISFVRTLMGEPFGQEIYPAISTQGATSWCYSFIWKGRGTTAHQRSLEIQIGADGKVLNADAFEK